MAVDPRARTEGARMLVLALTSYRGHKDSRRKRVKYDDLRAGVADALTLSPLEGDWTLAWGPGTYRARFSPFDDSLMYVARRRSDPRRIAVIIRGTNPVSLFDWIWGDLWTGALTRWGQGSSRAGVSLSTSLGLSILTTMRAPLPSLPDAPRRLGSLMPRELPPLPPPPPLRFPRADSSDRLRALRARLDHDLDDLWRKVPPEPPPHLRSNLRSRVARVRRFDAHPARARALKHVAEAQREVDDDRRFEVLRLMESRAARVNRQGSGTTLVEFLRGEVQRRGPLHVSVTGHSKGGALAVPLALWLAERQGGGGSGAHRWDPQGRSEVDAWSFAGPTGGNAEFAQRVHDVLGARLHRVANQRDMVPNTWVVAAARPSDGLCLERIPGLYGKPVALMESLLRLFLPRMASLGYRHPPGEVTLIEPPLGPRMSFLKRVSHHHTAAYLTAFGLDGEVSKDDFGHK